MIAGSRRLPLTEIGLLVYAVTCLSSMALMSIGAAVLLVCVLLDPRQGGPRGFWTELKGLFTSPLIRTYAAASLALCLATFLSLVSARWFPLSYGGGPAPEVRWLEDLGKSWYFALPLVLVLAWRRLPLDRQGRVLRAWILCFAVLSAVGVSQFFTGFPRAQPNPFFVKQVYYHPVLLLGHHLSVASIWIFPFFAALDLLTHRELRERAGISLKWLAPAFACAVFTLIMGYSRTLWVALPLGVLLWSAMKLPKKAVLGLLVGLVLAAAAGSQTRYVQERFTNRLGYDDRYELWKANLHFFEDRPVFGVGFRKNQELALEYFKTIHPEQKDFFIGHAHNVFLEVLAGSGAFGALAWLAWMGVVFAALARSLKSPYPLGFAAGALCAWLVFLLNGLTQVNFWEAKVLHQLMWMTGLILLWATRPAPEPR